MPCEQTTHVEHAKTKNFCPDCGVSLVLNQLNKFATENKTFTIESILLFIHNNDLHISEKYVLHEGMFYTVADFISTNPFMKFPDNFTEYIRNIYKCPYFKQAKLYHDQGIPYDIHNKSQLFLMEFNSFVQKHAYVPVDVEKIIEYCGKQIRTHAKDIVEKDDLIERYLLQDCLTEDGNIKHEWNDDFHNISTVKFLGFGFNKDDNILIRTFKTEDNRNIIFRKNKNAYFYDSCAKIQRCSKKEINDWLESRYDEWIRDKKIEEKIYDICCT